ncbi:hypothetical protein pb186bvf_004429 [Paramecium bursaria]
MFSFILEDQFSEISSKHIERIHYWKLLKHIDDTIPDKEELLFVEQNCHIYDEFYQYFDVSTLQDDEQHYNLGKFKLLNQVFYNFMIHLNKITLQSGTQICIEKCNRREQLRIQNNQNKHKSQQLIIRRNNILEEIKSFDNSFWNQQSADSWWYLFDG